jgi:CRP-like cAMP-binding protein
MGLKGRVIRYGRGRTLISEGERATDVYSILEGQAHVLLYSPAGREVAVRMLGDGDLFGELAALDGAPRCASVVAASDLRALTISRSDFLSCVEQTPGAHAWLTARLVAEVRRLTERVFELSALNVQSRLHCELLRLARAQGARGETLIIDPAPTHAELASRIGTHREAVTREMGVLVERNIIVTRRRALEFVDIASLEDAVSQAVGAMAELLRAN